MGFDGDEICIPLGHGIFRDMEAVDIIHYMYNKYNIFNIYEIILSAYYCKYRNNQL